MKKRLNELLTDLMMIPGLSGHEDRVRRHLAGLIQDLGLATRSDRLGNLIATIEGNADAPSVMLFAHMDQLGMMVRRIEPDGFIRVERLGGVPEKTLPGQAVLLCVDNGEDMRGVIANKSHHATPQDEKYRALPVTELFVDAGFADADAVREAGIEVGTPVVYEPKVTRLAGERVAGTSIDDRAGCAILVEVTRALKDAPTRPTTHVVFSVQEEFNLRGALTAAHALSPDIAIQLDLSLATDTPDLEARGEVRLGHGPVMSLYSFHGRGTLNGTLPHPALVSLIGATAAQLDLPLQRAATVGVLTDSSYVQHVNAGVACIDLGFPIRYSHSPLEVCDLADLEALARLVIGAISQIQPGFSLDRDDTAR